jgi:hypothetical protein
MKAEHSLRSAVRRLVTLAVGDSCITTDADDCLTVQSPADPSPQLTIHFRGDGDIDVALALPGVKGSPFEQHFIVHQEPSAAAAAAVADFVSDLIAERIVIAHVGGLKGGRRFIAPKDGEALRRAEWTASWRGTYDRDVPNRASR